MMTEADYSTETQDGKCELCLWLHYLTANDLHLPSVPAIPISLFSGSVLNLKFCVFEDIIQIDKNAIDKNE